MRSFLTRWTLTKDTGPNESQRVFVRFVPGVGFDDFESHINAAIRMGVIQAGAGGRFVVVDKNGEEQKIHGRDKLLAFYRERKEEFEVLKQRNLEAHAQEAPAEENEDAEDRTS